MSNQDAAVAAIQFALETDDGLTFLRLWNQGDFDKTRREWPEAPEAVYIGADPLHQETAIPGEVDPAAKIAALKVRVVELEEQLARATEAQ